MYRLGSDLVSWNRIFGDLDPYLNFGNRKYIVLMWVQYSITIIINNLGFVNDIKMDEKTGCGIWDPTSFSGDSFGY